jgi:hypothetical protein
LGVETQPGGVVKIDLLVATVAELSKKVAGVKAGTEGEYAHTLSMKEAGVYDCCAGSCYVWSL